MALSPLIAAKAAFTLNLALWFQRLFFIDLSAGLLIGPGDKSTLIAGPVFGQYYMEPYWRKNLRITLVLFCIDNDS